MIQPMKHPVTALAFLALVAAACDTTKHPHLSASGSPHARMLAAEPRLADTGAPASDGKTFSVISYNVHFPLASCATGRRCSADESTLDVIAAADADLLMLQETTPAWEQVLRPLLADRFEHVVFHDPPTSIAGGLALFSKFPIEKNELMASPLGWFPANRLVVRAPHGPMELLNVHLRPQISEDGSWLKGHFTTGPLRQRELTRYTASLDPALPTIVAGDFNEDETGEAFRDLVRLGFASALELIDPKATTWRYDFAGVPLTLRIDHVAFEKAGFEVVSAEVLGGGKSDHSPVKVVLRRRA